MPVSLSQRAIRMQERRSRVEDPARYWNRSRRLSVRSRNMKGLVLRTSSCLKMIHLLSADSSHTRTARKYSRLLSRLCSRPCKIKWPRILPLSAPKTESLHSSPSSTAARMKTSPVWPRPWTITFFPRNPPMSSALYMMRKALMVRLFAKFKPPLMIDCRLWQSR